MAVQSLTASVVDAPGYWEPGPAPAPKRGLFSVAEVHDDVDPHLMMGVEYLTNRCTAGCQWSDFCDPSEVYKNFMDLSVVRGTSSAVYDGLECAEVGVDPDEQMARLKGTFDVKAEAVIESTLHAILQGATPLPATSLPEMIAVLEEELAANYAGVGTLHMDRYTSLIAYGEQLIVEPNAFEDRVHTINGTPIALGRGYSRTSGKYWAGAAGRVIILRGPLITAQTPPALNDTPKVLVEQQFVILAECVATWTEAAVA